MLREMKFDTRHFISLFVICEDFYSPCWVGWLLCLLPRQGTIISEE
uniref:Uncharacterized protein n=1 Tax=Rhizophora mucronata TaxID=61149 RepID=A0A2P2LHB7_RHIMU